MHVSPSVAAALERVQARAADVERAFTPGAQPSFDDVEREQVSYPTVDPLSVAAPDDTYFVTRGAGGERFFTRGGALRVRDGQLCAANGLPVLGDAGAGRLQALRVDGVDLALGRAENPRVDARGDFLYDRVVIDPRSGVRERQTVTAGRIALARFPAATRLGQRGEAPSALQARYGLPSDGDFAPLRTMRRESSGIDIDEGLDRLRDAYRELDAMESVYRARYAAEKTAMDVVR
ncbi:MAG: hypothetical protein ACREMP_02280 [Candidatus Tyrphobacter sp.]